MSVESIDAIISGRRSQPQQLIEVLQDIQDEHGYLPQECMLSASHELGVPLIEVCRVASFYTAFSLKPRGKHVITLCTGTACHVRGSAGLLAQVSGQLSVSPGETTSDGLFTIEAVNCLGACALGPVVVLDGEYHDHVTPRKLSKLIESVREVESEASTRV